MALKLSNNAVSRLAGNLTTTDTAISLEPGDGALFPSLVAGDWFPATLINGAGEYEIIKVTNRSGDVLTAARAQEGTAATSFNAGDRIELRMTAGVFDTLQSQLLALLPTGFGPLPWSRTSAPDGWIWSDGRVLLPDTIYADLRAAYIDDSFPFGQDGSGNPKIPDMRGRVPGGVDNMGSGAAGRLSGASLGAAIGAQTHTLSTAEMPAHAHSVYDPGHAHSASQDNHSHTLSGIAMDRSASGYYLDAVSGGYNQRVALYPGSTSTNTGTTSGASASAVYIGSSGTGISLYNAGSGSAHNNVQPTLATHYILKT